MVVALTDEGTGLSGEDEHPAQAEKKKRRKKRPRTSEQVLLASNIEGFTDDFVIPSIQVLHQNQPTSEEVAAMQLAGMANSVQGSW